MAGMTRMARPARASRARTREELARRRRILLSGLCAEMLYRGVRVPQDVSDHLDQATVGVGQEIALSVAEKRWAGVLEIEEAMQRLSSGTYGICKSCGEEIGKARLKALPSACYCIRCQQEMERLGAEEEGDAPAWDMVEDAGSHMAASTIRGSARFQ